MPGGGTCVIGLNIKWLLTKRRSVALDCAGGAALEGAFESDQLLRRQRLCAAVGIWDVMGNAVCIIVKQLRCQGLAQAAGDTGILIHMGVYWQYIINSWRWRRVRRFDRAAV